MNKLYKILGIILLFPVWTLNVFGLDIDDFRDNVLRPDNLPAGTAAENVPAEAKINAVIGNVINFILFASGGLAVLLLIFAGIQYITSLGNQERMDAAKKTIKQSLLGLLVVIFAYAIITNIIDLIFRATV